MVDDRMRCNSSSVVAASRGLHGHQRRRCLTSIDAFAVTVHPEQLST